MIPIYRAKKIDGDEWVEGYLLPSLKRYDNKSFIVNGFTRFQGLTTDREVDPNTLAIHFPNMIDENGKKIFASLSEDGVGGDKLKNNNDFRTRVIFDMGTSSIYFKEYGSHIKTWEYSTFEVIGIHKGE